MYIKNSSNEEPTLGEQLQETLNIMKEALKKSDAERQKADIEQIKKDRQRKVDELEKIKTQIINNIKNGKVPWIKITDYNLKKWLFDAFLRKEVEFVAIWNEFVSFFQKQKCKVVVVEEHDGAGMESWVIVTVDPQLSTYRG